MDASPVILDYQVPAQRRVIPLAWISLGINAIGAILTAFALLDASGYQLNGFLVWIAVPYMAMAVAAYGYRTSSWSVCWYWSARELSPS